MLFRELVQRSCQETSCKDLVQRPGDENRDLVTRTEILLRDPLERLNRDLTLIYFDILYRELLWRSLIDALYR